jgi:putative transposase
MVRFKSAQARLQGKFSVGANNPDDSAYQARRWGDALERSAAAETRMSKSSVQRYFQLFGLQPHRTEGFRLSTDPFFIEKLHDVVGLYLSPPDNALVICVDEKTQCQALERTQPMLPLGLGYVEGVTHGYKRHGTTTLFAALNVISGAVLATCKERSVTHRTKTVNFT